MSPCVSSSCMKDFIQLTSCSFILHQFMYKLPFTDSEIMLFSAECCIATKGMNLLKALIFGSHFCVTHGYLYI